MPPFCGAYRSFGEANLSGSVNRRPKLTGPYSVRLRRPHRETGMLFAETIRKIPRRPLVQGELIGAIARDLGLSRNTARGRVNQVIECEW